MRTKAAADTMAKSAPAMLSVEAGGREEGGKWKKDG
jgi:hypothetical protein